MIFKNTNYYLFTLILSIYNTRRIVSETIYQGSYCNNIKSTYKNLRITFTQKLYQYDGFFKLILLV